MPQTVPYLRIFISSPGDVKDERKIALDVIDRLQYRPLVREKVAFRVIAWDKPGAGTAMRASLTPQEAINRGLPKPSECDIVVVLFWSRMGTPFDMDGEHFESGTHWELMDALNSDRPTTLIYRRTEEITVKMSDPKHDEKREQYNRLTAFLSGETFYKADGSIRRGVNQYQNPDDFRQQLELHLEECVAEILDDIGDNPPSAEPLPADSENVKTIEPSIWPGSPFPGLRAFTEADAPIYFGRGRETDALAQKVENERFVAVVGASGSGKSSLVAAGLLPRLKDEQATITKDWYYARFTPGEKPFEALAAALMEAVPTLDTEDPIDYPERLDKLTNSLRQNADRLTKTLKHALKDEAEWAEVLLFVDQFEELFTLAPEADRKPFVELLTHASEKIRVIITMRADFYHRAVPFLEAPLRTGTFTLDKPDQFALLEMIKRPAERAALEFEAGLPEQIVRDTGDEPGALALMAYALDELYEIAQARGDKRLTFADYEALGGVQGAIGQRAESVYSGLGEDAQAMLTDVFRELVAVDENGTPTRKRMPYDLLDGFEAAQRLVDAFTQARLMVQS